MTNLFVDFVAQILQALHVLARRSDTRLGLFAPLFITRDAGGFFDEGAHVIGFGLDDARDHALLDDGVAARAETCAEKQLRDVFTAAARTVQRIFRTAIARYLALQRHFGVTGIRAADLAVGIIEHQLNRGRSHRLASARAVKDDIGHRIAAQMLGGEFAHDPAHRIDDVRLAATVWPNHSRQITGECHGRWIHE